MNEHAGPACALSGLIVGLFAILLHDKNPPPPSAASQAGIAVPGPARVEGSIPDAHAAIHPPPPGASPAPAPAPAKAPVADRARGDRPGAQPPTRSGAPRGSGPTKPPVPAPKGPPLPSPRPPFAVVGPGESLEDVAARIYGSKGAAEALWKANRDQVERVDSALARGTLLRTP